MFKQALFTAMLFWALLLTASKCLASEYDEEQFTKDNQVQICVAEVALQYEYDEEISTVEYEEMLQECETDTTEQ